MLLSNLTADDISTIITCQEFDRKILNSCFKVACDMYLKQFLDIVAVYESREVAREKIKEEIYIAKLQDEMAVTNIDSNILNVANTLHVFKKSESRESKSQFFIPMSENKDSNIDDKFGSLHISDEDPNVIIPPEIPGLYLKSMSAFEKSITDIIRLFPKQNRPLSQSENFNLNIEQTIDRYTRRCHQVFQDKLFYHEFCVIQHIMAGYLESLQRIVDFINDLDCDLSEKILENILPNALARNIAIFTVISLQYISFLIKNKNIVESPVHAEVSFRVTIVLTEKIVVDNVIGMALDNSSKALSFKRIWCELNVESNFNRIQSAISCLYAVTKYFLKVISFCFDY